MRCTNVNTSPVAINIAHRTHVEFKPKFALVASSSSSCSRQPFIWWHVIEKQHKNTLKYIVKNYVKTQLGSSGRDRSGVVISRSIAYICGSGVVISHSIAYISGSGVVISRSVPLDSAVSMICQLNMHFCLHAVWHYTSINIRPKVSLASGQSVAHSPSVHMTLSAHALRRLLSLFTISTLYFILIILSHCWGTC